MHKIPLYEDARRKTVQLWKAKHSLSLAAQARFPKSYPVSKAIFKICHCDPTCTIRFIADKSACHCADRYGDDIFRREVDGGNCPTSRAGFMDCATIYQTKKSRSTGRKHSVPWKSRCWKQCIDAQSVSFTVCPNSRILMRKS